jgi:molybdate transport system substrate-binding protein
MKKLAFLIIIFLVFASAAYSQEQKQINFFCGSAVRVPMDEIIQNYEKETGVKVNVNYGGSGSLLSQMELAKKGDVYLSGSPDYILIGEHKGLLFKGTDKLLSYLVPAIIVPKGNPAHIRTLEDLAKPGVRLGMGNPQSVCLGLYGIELLDDNNLLDKVLSNVVVMAKSCEDTAALAVLKKVDAIIGWDVFASWNPNDLEWIRINPEKIKRLAYVAVAIPVFAKDKNLSLGFINYMLSSAGQEVFKRWGYISSEKEAKKYAPNAVIGGEYQLPQKYFKLIRHEE